MHVWIVALVAIGLVLPGCRLAPLLTGLELEPTGALPALDAAEHAADLGSRDHLRFLVFGDAGTGKAAQRMVAAAMRRTCAERGGCDFALVTGDLIYPSGIRATRGGTPDDQLERKFEAVYRAFGRFDFWLVTGNHDWYRRGSVAELIRHTRRSDRWRLPRVDYAIPGLPGWLSIYGLDTTLLAAGRDATQLARARRSLCAASGWRLLFGHHGVYSVGGHADRQGLVPGLREHLEPLIRACGVHLYFAGHDHLQAHISAPAFEQIVQGAGGRYLHRVRSRQLPQGVRLVAATSRHGFALVEATPSQLEVRFFAAGEATSEEIHCHRLALARFAEAAARGEPCGS